MQPGPLPRPGAQRRGRRKQKKKDILSDVLLGALEEIRTPDLLIRSQTLYPTELPAQVQDIYYHRHKGLSTVFAKKFEIFFAEQKKVLLPPSVGGRRALFSAADSPPAPLCARGCPCTLCSVPVHSAVSLRALGCPCAVCGVLRALRYSVCSGVRPMPALWCPCALCGVLRALGCPVRPVVRGVPCAPCGVPHALCGALCALGCPLPALGVSCVLFSVLCTPLQCPARLPQPCGALRPAIQSAPLPCLATTLSPAPRRSSPPPRRARQRKSPAAPKGAAGPCSFRCQAMRLR